MSVGRHLQTYPDEAGYYGRFGGAHYPDELKPHLAEIARAIDQIRKTADFQEALQYARGHFQGRPTPVQRLANAGALVLDLNWRP